ncbi:MAG: hypothetical protein R3345_11630, partial [Fulvivirga sp.]|nr:hypothetical protein [Fulvivirga sp.]
MILPLPLMGQSIFSDPVYHSAVEKEILSAFLNNDQTQSSYALQFISDQALTTDQLKSNLELIDDWVVEFKAKKDKLRDDEQLIDHIFYRLHRKVLKNYERHASLNRTFQEGAYDCLTGTALYAIIFNRLDIPFQIIETNYHIYLKIDLDTNRTILIESTDPINGFISGDEKVEERLSDMNNNDETITGGGNYQFEVNMQASIGLMNLAGLHYYNAAVDAFN